MKNPSSITGLTALCGLLELGAFALLAAAIWSFLHGQSVPGLLALGAGILLGGAGLGLYRRKRWGVVLFGLLALLGSINHMVLTFRRLEGLSAADTAGVLGAVVSIAVAILIPLGLAYVTYQMWKQAQ
jgi:LPXTG-motif cell wall-anchored protein